MLAGQQRYTTTIHWQSWVPSAGAWFWKTGHAKWWRKQGQTAWFRIQFLLNVSAIPSMIFFSTGDVLKSRVRSSDGTRQMGLGTLSLEVWGLKHLTICTWLFSVQRGWTLSNLIWRQWVQFLVNRENAAVVESTSEAKLSGTGPLTLYWANSVNEAPLNTCSEAALMILRAKCCGTIIKTLLASSIVKSPLGLWAQRWGGFAWRAWWWKLTACFISIPLLANQTPKTEWMAGNVARTRPRTIGPGIESASK